MGCDDQWAPERDEAHEENRAHREKIDKMRRHLMRLFRSAEPVQSFAEVELTEQIVNELLKY